MAEKVYIEREALEHCIREENHNLAGLIQHIREHCPTADVVEVVRCEDCKYIHGPQYGIGYCYPEGSASYRVVSLDDFCKYGKRRDTE